MGDLRAYQNALGFVLGVEGKLSNEVGDKGGYTDYGVTQATYNAWRLGRELPLQSVSLITSEEVSAVYFDLFWVPCRCPNLPARLDLCVFDAGVQHSDKEAIEMLQEALDGQVTGFFGPLTMGLVQRAVEAESIDAVIGRMLDIRRKFYVRIVERDVTQQKFINGWMNRIVRLRIAVGLPPVTTEEDLYGTSMTG